MIDRLRGIKNPSARIGQILSSGGFRFDLGARDNPLIRSNPFSLFSG